jgi:phosphopantothenoylcysteine synthetase/decarboxylase
MADDLEGKRILITSGPTRAPLDAVRYISNRSSGRLGSRIAAEALRCGAHVTLVAGADSATPTASEISDEQRARLRMVRIETVDDLIEALERRLTGWKLPDAIVHAMAVLDYVPKYTRTEKTPSGRDNWVVHLVKSPKVIDRIRELAPEALLVQFKLEVGLDDDALREAALASLRRNKADMVVANELSRIRGERHQALILEASGQVLGTPNTKGRIAATLCRLIARELKRDETALELD